MTPLQMSDSDYDDSTALSAKKKSWRRLVIAMCSIAYVDVVHISRPTIKSSGRAKSSSVLEYFRLSENAARLSYCHTLQCDIGLREHQTAILAKCLRCWAPDGFELVQNHAHVYSTRTGQRVHSVPDCGNSRDIIAHRVCDQCLPSAGP